MNNQNKKYGFIKSKKSKKEPEQILFDNNLPNINLLNQPNIINNNTTNENNLDFDNNENDDYLSSDIDDPKYKPNSLQYKDEFYNNNIQNLLNKNDNINYNLNNDSIRKSKYHNFDNLENIDINFTKENNFRSKNIIDLENENELLKQDLLKKSETIRAKDELISEFQNIYKDLKIKFEQYESKNAQQKQQIKFLESQIESNKNQLLSQTQSNNLSKPEMNERTISLFKQQINDIESEYNNKIKKLTEKFKDKENKINQEHIEETSKLNKAIESMRVENSKLKSEISNNNETRKQ